MRCSSIAFALLVVAGCGKTSGDEATKPPPPAPVKVALAKAISSATPLQIVLTGLVVANQRAEVTADTQGKVLAVMVERGARVKFGDPVVRLDVRSAALGAREMQANLASARSQLKLAQDECERTKLLLDRGAITRSEYDRQIAQCTAAVQQVSAVEARTAMVAKSVTDGIVRAPFDGVVAEKMVAPGEWVAPGRPLFTLIDSNPLRVELSIAEVAVRAVREGQRVDVISVAYPDQTFHATITRIGPEIGRTRSLTAEATLDPLGPAPDAKPASELRPGMFVEAHLTIGSVDRSVVPAGAVVMKCWVADGSTEYLVLDEIKRRNALAKPARCGKTWHVFRVAANGELEDVIVQRGPDPGPGTTSIVDSAVRGIAAGDKVVAKVTPDIRDGMRVVE